MEKAKEGNVEAILDLDAQAFQRNLFQRARQGDSKALEKIEAQKEKEHGRLADLVHTGNPHALEELTTYNLSDSMGMSSQKEAVLMKKAQKGDPGAKKALKEHALKLANAATKNKARASSELIMMNQQKRIQGKRKKSQKLKGEEKLRRDKYGRRVDMRGKQIQKLKPFKVTITRTEAKRYHSNIIEYGPICLAVGIALLMLLVALFYTSNRQEPGRLKRVKQKVIERTSEKVVETAGRILAKALQHVVSKTTNN